MIFSGTRDYFGFQIVVFVEGEVGIEDAPGWRWSSYILDEGVWLRMGVRDGGVSGWVVLVLFAGKLNGFCCA